MQVTFPQLSNRLSSFEYVAQPIDRTLKWTYLSAGRNTGISFYSPSWNQLSRQQTVQQARDAVSQILATNVNFPASLIHVMLADKVIFCKHCAYLSEALAVTPHITDRVRNTTHAAQPSLATTIQLNTLTSRSLSGIPINSPQVGASLDCAGPPENHWCHPCHVTHSDKQVSGISVWRLGKASSLCTDLCQFWYVFYRLSAHYESRRMVSG